MLYDSINSLLGDVWITEVIQDKLDFLSVLMKSV